MRRKKCLATFTMAAMVAASLAGCSSSGEKTDNSQAAVSGETTVSDSGEKKKDSGSATVVSMWHMWSGSEAEAFQTVIDDFNASQDEIQVEVLASQTEEKMLTAIPSGDGPDIVHTSDTTCSKWAQAGLLSTLDSYITSENVKVDDIYPSVYALGTYGGEQYGLPYTMDSYMLFYNKGVLDELGLEPPKTLEEMAEMCKQVTVKDANGEYTRLGYVPDYPWIDRVEIPYLFGAEFYDFDNDQVTCTSDEFKNALNYKAQFYTEYGIPEVTKFKSGFGAYASNDNALFQGKTYRASHRHCGDQHTGRKASDKGDRRRKRTLDGISPSALYDAGRKYDDGIRIRKRSDLHGGGFRARSGRLVFLVFRRNAMGRLRAGRLLHRDLGSGG